MRPFGTTDQSFLFSAHRGDIRACRVSGATPEPTDTQQCGTPPAALLSSGEGRRRMRGLPRASMLPSGLSGACTAELLCAQSRVLGIEEYIPRLAAASCEEAENDPLQLRQCTQRSPVIVPASVRGARCFHPPQHRTLMRIGSANALGTGSSRPPRLRAGAYVRAANEWTGSTHGEACARGVSRA